MIFFAKTPANIVDDSAVWDALEAVGAADVSLLVYQAVLNSDVAPERLISAADGVCGNAGCANVLLDAKSRLSLGTFSGHLAILDEYVNGSDACGPSDRQPLGTELCPWNGELLVAASF